MKGAILLLFVATVCQGLQNAVKSNQDFSPLLELLKKAVQHTKHQQRSQTDYGGSVQSGMGPHDCEGSGGGGHLDDWSGPVHVDSVEDVEDMFMFPGSHYLISIIEEWQMNERTATELQAEFKVRQTPVFEDLEAKMPQFMQLTDDSETMALVYTRMIMKEVLHGRMMCPSAVLDSYMAEFMTTSLEKMSVKGDTSMFTFLVRKIPELFQFSVPEYMVDQLAADAVREIHGHIFNDTIQYFLSSGFMDVAMMSHQLYSTIHDFCEDKRHGVQPMYDSLYSLVEHAALNNDVRCKSFWEMKWSHMTAVDFFQDRFEYVETSDICELVKDYLKENAVNIMHLTAMASPEDPVDLLNMTVVNETCDAIKHFIDDVVYQVTTYETVLASENESDVLKFLSSVIDPPNLEVVEDAWNLLYNTTMLQYPTLARRHLKQN